MYKIGLIGSPSAGKSTLAAQVYHRCKILGIQTELVQEFVREELNKGWIMRSVSDQIRLQMKQREKEDIIPSNIEVLVTDSPTLLQYIYGLRFSKVAKEDIHALTFLYEEYIKDSDRYDKIYYVNNIRSDISPDGTRKESAQECAAIGEELKIMMRLHHIPFIEVDGNDTAIDIIMADIQHAIKK